MKNLLAFLLIHSFLQNINCQDWSLFPLGQKTCWESDGEFHFYYNDSTKVASNLNIHFFGEKYLTQDSMYECYNQIMENEYQLNEPPIDSLYSTGSYWFGKINTDTIYFYHKTNPGDSWSVELLSVPNIDSLFFSCELISEENLFGIMDSVKYYEVKGYKNGNIVNNPLGVDYILSKKHGLTKFLPFNSLIGQAPEFELMGFDNGQEYGFVNSWKNYFGEFKEGQIMKWWDIKYGVDTPPGFVLEEKYFIDSIIAVNFTDDAVTLSVEQYGRSYLWKNGSDHSSNADSTYSFSSLKNISHSKGQFSHVLGTVPGWLKIIPVQGRTLYYTAHDFSAWDLPSIKFNDWEYQFDSVSTECDKLIADPQYLDKVMARGLGIIHEGLIGGFWFIHLETKLLGYGFNGEYFGDVLNPTFSRPIPSFELTIYPNPAQDFIYIDLLEKNYLTEMNLKIITPSGKIVFDEKINQQIERVNISDLPVGIYFVIVNGENVFGRERFVKY